MTRFAAFAVLMVALAVAVWPIDGIRFIAALCVGAALFFVGWAYVPDDPDDPEEEP